MIAGKNSSPPDRFIQTLITLIFLLSNDSSNINEVIRTVLNSLFFLRKDFARTKAPKVPKAQRHNQAKVQNATSEQ